MSGGFSADDVHDLRLDLKRLKALLEMLDRDLPEFEIPEVFRFFKKKYRRLGRFREAEQLILLAKNSKKLSPQRRKLAKKVLSKRLEKAEKKLGRAFFKKIATSAKRAKKTLLKDAGSFRPAAFHEWMAARSLELRSVDPQNLRTEADSHEYRKKLKAFLCNLALASPRERLFLEKNCPQPPDADNLQNSLGDRHDRAVWRMFLAGLGRQDTDADHAW